MSLTPYVASLRVYEPLESFDNQIQKRFAAIPFDLPTRSLESEHSIKSLVIFNRAKTFHEGVHLIDLDGRRFVCPWSRNLRILSAMEEFRTSIPSSIYNFFIPKEVDSSLSEDSSETFKRVSHIITERWMIPPRWFALFDPKERMVGYENSEAFTLFRTQISSAKRRCLETHAIVKNAFGEGSVEAEISLLFAWLEVFDDNSLLELDYGGLAGYLDNTIKSSGGEGIVQDTSIEDVIQSVAGLATGDGVLAGEGYGKVISRWRQIASFEQAQ
jgi:hypothetical protein